MRKVISKTDFIQLADAIYGTDRYDYSEVPETLKEYSKIKVFCKIHNYHFEVFVCNFLKGNTLCNECITEIKTKEFISKCIEKYGNHCDYSLVVFEHCHKPVKIICPIHGIFEITPSHFLEIRRTYDCKECHDEAIRKEKEDNFLMQCR